MTLYTTKHNWSMPDPGGSPNTWGDVLNSTTGAIDQAVWANEQAAPPVGTISMWAGAVPPANWLLCDGRAYATAIPYDKLAAVCNFAYGGSSASGQFNVPNLQGTFPMGVGPSNALGTSGAGTTTIAANNLPVHTHAITDPPAHTHAITDQTHGHTVVQSADHIHGDAGHGHAGSTITAAAHTHQLPGGFGFGIGGTGPSPLVPSGYGVQAATGGASASGGSANIAAGFASLGGASPPVSVGIVGNSAGITVTLGSQIGLTTTGNNATTASPISVVPKYVAVNFIIRFQ